MKIEVCQLIPIQIMILVHFRKYRDKEIMKAIIQLVVEIES